jgi:hypothetical protein
MMGISHAVNGESVMSMTTDKLRHLLRNDPDGLLRAFEKGASDRELQALIDMVRSGEADRIRAEAA